MYTSLKKRILAFTMAVLMAFTMIPEVAKAEGEDTKPLADAASITMTLESAVTPLDRTEADLTLTFNYSFNGSVSEADQNKTWVFDLSEYVGDDKILKMKENPIEGSLTNVLDYWIKDNVIYITFVDGYWSQSGNQNGKGGISFDLKLNPDKLGEGNEISFDFPGSSVTLPVRNTNVTANKAANSHGVDTNSGRIEPGETPYVDYFITVTPDTNNLSTLKVQDKMGAGQTIQNNKIIIQRSDNSEMREITVNPVNGEFEVDLVQIYGSSDINRNVTYTLSYKTDALQVGAVPKNDAKVIWTGGEYNISAGSEKSLWQGVLGGKQRGETKTEAVQDGDSTRNEYTVDFTITVGDGNTDLGGFVLKDALENFSTYSQVGGLVGNPIINQNGSKIGEISVTPGQAGFEYEFPAGAKGPYTITYQVSTEYAKNADGTPATGTLIAINKASVERPDEPEHTETVYASSDWLQITEGNNNPGDDPNQGDGSKVDKQFVSFDTENSRINWSIEVTVPEDTTYENAVVRDYNATYGASEFDLNYGTWYNGNRLQFDTTNVSVTNKEGGEYSGTYEASLTDGGMQVKFPLLSESVVIRFSTAYNGIGGFDAIDSGLWFGNEAQLVTQENPSYQPTSTAKKKYSKDYMVSKAPVPGADGSYYDASDETVTWEIMAITKENETDYIVDYLPEGMELVPGSVTYKYYENDNYAPVNPLPDDKMTYGLVKELESEYYGRYQIVFTSFKPEKANSMKLFFSYKTKLTDRGAWVEKIFTNEVELQDSNHVKQDDASADVTVKRSALSKSGSDLKDLDNIEYTIEVNKEKIAYNNYGSLVLVDSLPAGVTLQQAYTINGKKSVIKVVDEKNNIVTDGVNCRVATDSMEITVPDGEHLFIYYTVRVSNLGTQTISNTVNFKGAISSEAGTSREYTVVGHKVWFTSDAGTISFSKRDLSDTSEGLDGAIFKIYRVHYDSNYVVTSEEEKHTVETKNGGKAIVKDIDVNAIGEDPALYYWKEVQAPGGYVLEGEPHYFFLYPADSKDTNASIPLELADKLIANNDSIKSIEVAPNGISDKTVTNKKIVAKVALTATKKVANYGKPLNDGDYEFQIVQAASDTKKVTLPATNAINRGEKIVFEDMIFPATGVYHFTVSEVEKNNVDIEYSVKSYNLTVTVGRNAENTACVIDSVTWEHDGQEEELVKTDDTYAIPANDSKNDNDNNAVNATFVNVYNPVEKTSFTATKVWDDNDNSAEKRASYGIMLLANGVPASEEVMLDANTTSYTWDQLRKNDKNGEPIIYSVVETSVPSEYASTVSADGTTITNTFVPDSITVEKKWQDEQGKNIEPAGNISLQVKQVKTEVLPIKIADGKYLTSADTIVEGEKYLFAALTYDNSKEVFLGIRDEALKCFDLAEDVLDSISWNLSNGQLVTANGKPGYVEHVVNEYYSEFLLGYNTVDGDTQTEYVGGKLHLTNGDKSIYISGGGSNASEWNFQIANEQANGTTFKLYRLLEREPKVIVSNYGSTITLNAPSKSVNIGALPLRITEVDGTTYDCSYFVEEAAVGGFATSYSADKEHSVKSGVIIITNKKESKTTTVKLSKKEVNGTEELPNAHLAVYKASDVRDDGKVKTGATAIEAWTSGKEVHEIELDAGDYVMIETTAPDGYDVAENISFSVTEDGKVVVGGKDADGGVVTMEDAPTKINITVTKKWDDKNNQDGVRPESITVNLLADGEKIDSVEVTAADDWKYEFKNLDQFKAGAKIVYTITEDKVEGYTTEVSGYNITNTHEISKVEVKGTKTWVDNNNQDGKRPEKITVNLLADGEKVDSVTVTAADNWKYEFKNLDEFKAGAKIEYTITEDKVEGYDATVIGYNIENNHKPETVTISGTKTWSDGNNQDGKRPESITVNLLADGTAVKSVIVTVADDWKYEFKDLPKYADGKEIVYTIAEDEVEGYEATVSGYSIENKHTPETVTISGAKTWTDNDDQDGVRPENITVKVMNGDTVVKSATVTAADDWKYEFKDLPKYADGKEIKYTIAEDEVAGYEATVSGYNIENKHTPETVTISGVKTWTDNDDQDGVRPESITVKVMNGTTVVKSATVTAADDWKYEFKDLPKYAEGKEIVYTITEDKVEGYTTKVNGYNITNTHEISKVEVKGTKTWVDNDNQDGVRPESITVNLLADGEKVDSVSVTAADDWKYEFKNLDEFKAGAKIEYTITEDEVEGYSTEVNGYNITNTHEISKVEVKGTKTWTDNDDQDGVRPESITVKVMNGETVVKSAIVTAADDWKYEFKDLPKYADGKEIVYTIAEDEVEGYEATVTGYNIENKHNPEITEVKVTKIWDDNSNQDGLRPSEITIKLLADGKVVDQKKLSGTGNTWSYTFTGLDMYAAGKKIIYTVEEVKVDNYTTSASEDTLTITNIHIPEITYLEVTKAWADNGNQYNKRPESILVTLYADGVSTGKTVSLTYSDGWAAKKFTDLDKYKDGKEIVYTVVENAVNFYEAGYVGGEITNTCTYIPDLTNISVTKVWADSNDADGIRPISVTANLLADGTVVDSATLNESNNWTWTFKDLPVDAGGAPFVYTIEEAYVPVGYEVDYSHNGNNWTILNSHTSETTKISIAKVWDDDNNRDGIRANEITVQLLANGAKVREEKLNVTNNWQITFTDLPKNVNGKEILYTVDEIEVPGYTTSIVPDGENHFEITNMHAPELTSVTVTKQWNDGSNIDGIRGDYGVTLYANGIAVGEEVILNQTQTEYTWSNLVKYEKGELIDYTVDETTVPAGYTKSIDGTVITNTHKPAVTQVSVTKVWEDENNSANIRPAQITVRLYANGTQVRTANLDASNNWSFTFTELAVKNHETWINYTITEDPVEGYQTVISGSATAGYTVTNYMPKKGPEKHSPKTNDPFGLWSVVATASASLSAMTYLFGRRKKEEEE